MKKKLVSYSRNPKADSFEKFKMLINCSRFTRSSRNYLKIRQQKIRVPNHHFCKSAYLQFAEGEQNRIEESCLNLQAFYCISPKTSGFLREGDLSLTGRINLFLSQRKRKARAETIEMEIKNLRLIIKNQSIIEENEKLRKRALQLQQENKDLLSQLHKANDHFNANQ